MRFSNKRKDIASITSELKARTSQLDAVSAELVAYVPQTLPTVVGQTTTILSQILPVAAVRIGAWSGEPLPYPPFLSLAAKTVETKVLQKILLSRNENVSRTDVSQPIQLTSVIDSLTAADPSDTAHTISQTFADLHSQVSSAAEMVSASGLNTDTLNAQLKVLEANKSIWDSVTVQMNLHSLAAQRNEAEQQSLATAQIELDKASNELTIAHSSLEATDLEVMKLERMLADSSVDLKAMEDQEPEDAIEEATVLDALSGLRTALAAANEEATALGADTSDEPLLVALEAERASHTELQLIVAAAESDLLIASAALEKTTTESTRLATLDQKICEVIAVQVHGMQFVGSSNYTDGSSWNESVGYFTEELSGGGEQADEANDAPSPPESVGPIPLHELDQLSGIGLVALQDSVALHIDGLNAAAEVRMVELTKDRQAALESENAAVDAFRSNYPNYSLTANLSRT
eukprot:GILJ01027281.1.p1 GENE.GILJ01027281.1~~GILJ01027281.1.p1  ORF type:complete len:464 (+),score=86.04 GILJ01027281.1:22-1413(+)